MDIEEILMIAMDIIKEQTFEGSMSLFESGDISDYRITDEDGSMMLQEFCEEFARRILENE